MRHGFDSRRERHFFQVILKVKPMSDTYQLKDRINSTFIDQLSVQLKKNIPSFKPATFKKSILHSQWPQLELKQRLSAVTEQLHTELNLPYRKQIEVLMKVAPHFSGLQGLVFPEFVSRYGLKDRTTSLKALETFTTYSTAEFAIRFFILEDLKGTLAQMLKWSRHKNEHIRRLASEGCRPRLPWSFKLQDLIDHPKLAVPILENLNQDPSLYVRKSVANHLNDISKDHPELALKLAQAWLKNSNEHTRWIVKHGLRTLLKARNPVALKLFGVHSAKDIRVKALKTLKPQFKIGEHLEFQFELHNNSKATKDLRLEYVIHYVKKSGERSPKVFQMAEKSFQRGRHNLKRRHSLKPMTTRQHYPGPHKLEIVVNGASLATLEFQLNR